MAFATLPAKFAEPAHSVPSAPSAPSAPTVSATSAQGLAQRYAEVRAHSLVLAAPLSAEDQCVQSMPDASPTKWHLAHISWFFEAMVLRPHVPGYQPYDPRFFYLFNSYYEALGPRHPRPMRGLLTRPSVDEVRAFRAHVDAAMQGFMA
ncbi:MAG: sulfatase maturase, partial [Rhodoferax sp.]|nr:sulfatase maturase [Rhodoferax sp.]